MKKLKKSNSEVIYDFTEIKKDRQITINKSDEKYLLCIHVRGFGPGVMKKEEFILLKRNARVTQYLITGIKYFKNKKFKAELIFIKWLD